MLPEETLQSLVIQLLTAYWWRVLEKSGDDQWGQLLNSGCLWDILLTSLVPWKTVIFEQEWTAEMHSRFRKFELREANQRTKENLEPVVTKRDVLPKFYIWYDVQKCSLISNYIGDPQWSINAHTVLGSLRIPGATGTDNLGCEQHWSGWKHVTRGCHILSRSLGFRKSGHRAPRKKPKE